MITTPCPDRLASHPTDSAWALYGLASNPPHAGHWACVRQLLDLGRNVLVAPSYAHAFGKEMAPFETRLTWLEEARHDFGLDCERVIVWRAEAIVAMRQLNAGPIYSIEMLRYAQEQYGGNVALALGPDNAATSVFSRFHQHDAIAREHGLVVLKETAGVRSTIIRKKIIDGTMSVKELSSFVGPTIAPSVFQYFGKI